MLYNRHCNPMRCGWPLSLFQPKHCTLPRRNRRHYRWCDFLHRMLSYYYKLFKGLIEQVKWYKYEKLWENKPIERTDVLLLLRRHHCGTTHIYELNVWRILQHVRSQFIGAPTGRNKVLLDRSLQQLCNLLLRDTHLGIRATARVECCTVPECDQFLLLRSRFSIVLLLIRLKSL